MQLPAFLLCVASAVMTYGATALWQALRQAPLAIEDENGFRIIRTDGEADEYSQCHVERHTLWP